MRKRLLAAALALCLILSSCAGAKTASSAADSTAEGRYTPGTYTETAVGMGGDVVVEMTFDAMQLSICTLQAMSPAALKARPTKAVTA